jgi:glycosyltransferase involved in cell wall biosynthesis
MFPRLSETFILNELLELERQDTELSVYSLMHPNDGRFHGRLAELQLAAEYFPRDKPESSWNSIGELPQALAPSFDRWSEAADFLRRHSIPGDLDLLLRSVLIGARAKAQGIQHLHAHFATVATRVAALVSMLTDIPFSFTAHAKDIFRTTVDRGLFAELVDRAAFAITVSDFNRDFILSHTSDIDGRKIIRLYNGVDLDFFTPNRPRQIPDLPHIVSVGRLVPKKGFDHLLRALRACKDEGFRFRATIVGDGAEMQNLLVLRRELDLDSDVMFLGGLPQENVRELLAEASMVALACVPDQDGNMDALPTVLLEALALDVPVVSTRLTGVPEIVGDEAGLLVDPGDDAGLARAIRKLWEQTRSCAQPPGRVRARGERLFDLRKNVAVLRDLFADSTSGNRISEAV